MNIDNYIDKRNRTLYNELLKNYSFSFETHDGHHYYTKSIDKEITLYIPERDATIELLTHELLHIYLGTRGINPGNLLKHRLRYEPLLHWTLNENLMEQIGHFLEHTKMLPVYLSMGFSRDLFCENYFMPCCSQIGLQLIQSGFNKAVPASASIDLYINKFFAMKCCVNPDFDYSSYLQTLRLISPELYSILNEFFEKWNAYEISRLPRDSKSLIAELVHALGLWMIKQVYVREKQRA